MLSLTCSVEGCANEGVLYNFETALSAVECGGCGTVYRDE